MQKINKFKLSLILILPFTLVHMNASGSDDMPDALREFMPGHKEYNVAKSSMERLVKTSGAEWLEEQNLYLKCGRVPDANYRTMFNSNKILCEKYNLHTYTPEELKNYIKSNEKFIKEIRDSGQDTFEYNLAPRGDAVEAAKLLLKYRISQNKTAGAGAE